MTLSVLTLNVWHDSGPWKARAGRIREWLDLLDPDLIGFQEVLRGPGIDQVAELLEGRTYHEAFVEAMPFWRDPKLSFGNAVASRWPIVAREELRLPDRGDGERRAAITAKIDADVPGGELSFTSTHLHWRFHHGNTRELQVQALADQVLRLRPQSGFPPILVGDFNAEPDSAEIRYLTGLVSLGGRSVYLNDAWRVAGEGGDGVTWSNRNPYARSALEPERRIDYIFAGYPFPTGVGLLERCRVVCNDEKDGIWPTDHFGVYAELATEARQEI